MKKLLKPEQSLSQRVVRGGVWVFTLQIVNRGFSFVRLIIIARILVPHDFGLMGIALLTMATLNTFSQTGFNTALIQKKEDVESYLNSAWTITIIRGIILFIILYLIAPYAATFFKAPEAKPIIQVIGFSILFQAFTNIGIIYFQKELEFNKQFVYQLSGTLANFIVAVSAVLILRNVWALVFGSLAGSFVGFIASYLIHPYRPHLSFHFGKAKELFGFGKWILGSSILIFLITQGDDAFVGKFLGVAALGFYQLAYRISNMPATEITHVISQVTFPAYSKLQDNIPKLREAYLKVLQVTAFLSFPVAGLIFVLAPDFTRIFLGQKWMPAVPVMQVLAIFGATRALNATNGPIFYALRKPQVATGISLIQLIFLTIIIYPFTSIGKLIGVSWAVTIANGLCFLMSFYKTSEYIQIKKLKIFYIFSLPILSTLGFMSSVYLFRYFTANKLSSLYMLITSILIALATYLIYNKILNLLFKQSQSTVEVQDLLKKVFYGGKL